MKFRKIIHVTTALAILAGMLALPACNDWDMTPKSDFAEKTMQQHYQNGEMNEYEYQDNLKVFQRPSTTPAASTSAPAGTAEPAASSSSTAKPSP